MGWRCLAAESRNPRCLRAEPRLNLNLNSSDSRELDQIQLRLGDGEPGTLKEGERYPIQTSSFSSLSGSIPKHSGTDRRGSLRQPFVVAVIASGGCALGSAGGVSGPGPDPEDHRQRDARHDVALTIEMQISALSGSAINGNPILNNRAYSGVVTIKEGSAVVVASELDRSESRNISGTPGLSEIPGLNNLTDKDVQKNYATLLIIITPHVIRGTQAGGHSQMIRIEEPSPVR